MILNRLKAIAFIAALAIISATMNTGTAEAGDALCKDPGTECHVKVNGQWYNLKGLG